MEAQERGVRSGREGCMGRRGGLGRDRAAPTPEPFREARGGVQKAPEPSDTPEAELPSLAQPST